MAVTGPAMHSVSRRDVFGCRLDTLEDNRQIGAGLMSFHRRAGAKAPGPVTTPGNSDLYLIGVSLRDGHKRRIFDRGRSTIYEFNRNCVYVRDMSDAYEAELGGSFDFTLMEIAKADLDDLFEGAEAGPVRELMPVIAKPDPLLAAMLAAVFSANGSHNTNRLFIDHMSAAIGVHMAGTYGRAPSKAAASGRALSKRDLTRIRDYLAARMSIPASLDELAALCSMPRSTFLSSFRLATGTTPHGWLTEIRMAHAKTLLAANALSLEEIAVTCGFDDTAQFSDVFSIETGLHPDIWRRIRLS
jgi:AraC family transcriptional regulator